MSRFPRAKKHLLPVIGKRCFLSVLYSAALSARSKVANDAYGQDLQDYFDSLTVEYKEGFEVPDLMQYLQ